MKKDCQSYILLISMTEPIEAFNVCNLLESGGIKFLQTSNISGPYQSEIDGPLAQVNIYVDYENLAAARELLDSLQANMPLYKRNKDVSKIGRLIPLFISTIFFVLYLFSTNGKDISGRYVLFGISLLFFIAFLFTFQSKLRRRC